MISNNTLLAIVISSSLVACSSGEGSSTQLTKATTQIMAEKSPSEKAKSKKASATKIQSTTQPQNARITIGDITTTIPSSLGSLYTKHFNRYIPLVAPNGRSFHIVAQSQISNEQLLRAALITQHYLTDFKGSSHGENKTAIANKMADNQSILALLNGSDNGRNPISQQVTGQPLYEEEIQVEGGKWYMTQNYEHRDAAFEEILHWVHDNGIGVDETDGTPSTQGAAPAYQKAIRKAQKNALAHQLWGLGRENAGWIEELTQENSLSQEYLAAVIDSYYGLWGAWKDSKTHGMWGIYTAKDRQEIIKEDPMGNEVMRKFFHPYLTYNANISPTLKGNFSLKFDASKPYTHHSRYLKDITLLGTNNNTVTVNQFDNHITGNTGNNTIIFTGNVSDYTIQNNNGTVIVSDKIAHRDGVNTLTQIETLQFADKTIPAVQ